MRQRSSTRHEMAAVLTLARHDAGRAGEAERRIDRRFQERRLGAGRHRFRGGFGSGFQRSIEETGPRIGRRRRGRIGKLGGRGKKRERHRRRRMPVPAPSMRRSLLSSISGRRGYHLLPSRTQAIIDG